MFGIHIFVPIFVHRPPLHHRHCMPLFPGPSSQAKLKNWTKVPSVSTGNDLNLKRSTKAIRAIWQAGIVRLTTGAFFFSIAFDSSISKFCWERSSSKKFFDSSATASSSSWDIGHHPTQIDIDLHHCQVSFFTVASKYFRMLPHGRLLSALQIRFDS